MKLTSLKTKTAIEVTDDDLLLIEDREDTKTITVGQFKLLMNTYRETRLSALFNECIDRMVNALEKSKFVIPTEQKFLANMWIGSTSGNIQITLRDLATNKWLTREDLVALIMDENGDIKRDFKVELFADGVYNEPKTYQLLNFIDFHDRNVNEWLYDSNAGFIKVSFGEFSQNTIAGIQYNDIIITLENYKTESEDGEVTEEKKFIFITSKDSFANSVPYVSVIPPGDPEWLNGK